MAALFDMLEVNPIESVRDVTRNKDNSMQQDGKYRGKSWVLGGFLLLFLFIRVLLTPVLQHHEHHILYIIFDGYCGSCQEFKKKTSSRRHFVHKFKVQSKVCEVMESHLGEVECIFH